MSSMCAKLTIFCALGVHFCAKPSKKCAVQRLFCAKQAKKCAKGFLGDRGMKIVSPPTKKEEAIASSPYSVTPVLKIASSLKSFFSLLTNSPLATWMM